MMRACARFIGFLTTFLFVAVLPALAQEHEVTPAESSTGYIYRWVNFAIVFALIFWVCVKFAGPAFRKRADEISQKIAEGTLAREAAERQRREIQTKVAGLENEIRGLRAQAKLDAEAEAERLRALARIEAEKIERVAEAEIEAAGRAARIELKALAAHLAIERAEALLRQEMTPNADAALFQTFVAELERSVN